VLRQSQFKVMKITKNLAICHVPGEVTNAFRPSVIVLGN
jgi:hypothetical protein